MKTLRKSFIKKKPFLKASAKAQSAMEYLMTYGWAILIVAVVLGALYSLGVFNGAAFLGTSCIAASGFYCTNPTLSTGGVLTVTIGQATGTTFKNAYLYFVPSGTNFSTSDPGTSIGILNSGQQVTVSIPLGVGSPYPAAYTLGTPLSGYIYLQFTDIYGITEVNKIATVLTKVTASSSGATFSQPTSIPSGIVAYVPITLTNSQSSATPSPFQQMIQINEGNYANYIAYNGNIANFEFFTQSGQILPAWIESNNSGTLTVWVNLPNGIPASSSLTIYLGFASKTTNLLSNSGTTGIGEAPQLSSTYAQYDDGASVFPYYVNFAGTSAPSSITTLGTATSFNNGATVSAGDFFETNSKVYNIQTQILDAYVSSITFGTSGDNAGISFVVDPSGNQYTSTTHYVNVGTSGGQFYNGVLNQFSTSSNFEIASLNSGTYTISSTTTTSTGIWSLWATSSTAYGSINYGSPLTVTSNIPPAGSYYIMAGASSGASTVVYRWVRVRAYPPNGVMPSVSFGGLSSA